jgi:hypothetical protein
MVWQAVVVAILLATVLHLLRQRSANARYFAAGTALLSLPILLVATFVAVPTEPTYSESAAAESTPTEPSATILTATGAPVDSPSLIRLDPSDLSENRLLNSSEPDALVLGANRKTVGEKRIVAKIEKTEPPKTSLVAQNDPKPSISKPSISKPSISKPSISKPSISKPIDPKPEQPQLDESIREDPKPIDPKPIDPKPIDPKPPASDRPIDDPKTEKPKTADQRDFEEHLRAITYFQGAVDPKRSEATMRWLNRKLRADVIVVAKPGIATSSEGIVRALYHIQYVIKDNQYRRSYLTDNSRAGNSPLPDTVVLYADTQLQKNALPVPAGPVLLFLEGALGKSGDLKLFDTDRPNDGSVHATEQNVRETVDALIRMQRLLKYFEDNDAKLKVDKKRGYIIEETKDGATANTSFFVYPNDRSGNDIRKELSHISLATLYNPYCQMAMTYPGITGPPVTPDGWKTPAQLARHMEDGASFVKLFQNYRPPGTEISPRKAEVDKETNRLRQQIEEHFSQQGIKLKLSGPNGGPIYQYYVADPATEGFQIAFGVWGYPARYSKREIEKDLLQYNAHLTHGYSLNGNYVLWNPIFTNSHLNKEHRKKAAAQIALLERLIKNAFQKLPTGTVRQRGRD